MSRTRTVVSTILLCLAAGVSVGAEGLVLLPPGEGTGGRVVHLDGAAPDEAPTYRIVQHLWRAGRRSVERPEALDRPRVAGVHMFRVDAAPVLDDAGGGILRRYAKSVIVIGDAEPDDPIFRSELGQPLELLLRTDPVLLNRKARGSVAVQALYDREPLSAASVVVGRPGAASRTLRADDSGVVRFDVDATGPWSVVVRHSGICDSCGGDMETLVSTLTIVVGTGD